MWEECEAVIVFLYYSFLMLACPLANMAIRIYVSVGKLLEMEVTSKGKAFVFIILAIYAGVNIGGIYGLLINAKGWIRSWATLVLLESVIYLYADYGYTAIFSLLAFKDCELILGTEIKWV